MKKTFKPLVFLISGILLLNSCIDEDVIPMGNEVEIDYSITSSATWSADSIYIIDGPVYVSNGAVLTINPGTVIKFNAGASLHFGDGNNATVLAKGTTQKPIVFTSNSPSPSSGAWEGVFFHQNTMQNSVLKNCIIEFAGGNGFAALTLSGCDIAIDSCDIKESANLGVYTYYSNGKGGFVTFRNNTFTDIALYDVVIDANKVHTISAENSFENSVLIYGQYNSMSSQSWRKFNVPYVIDDVVFIDGNLVIEPGATFKFDADGYLNIGSLIPTKLTAIGTPNEPITFTSFDSNPEAGAWIGLEFYDNIQPGSTLSYCIIEYAGKTHSYAINLSGAVLNFTHSTIRESNGTGIECGNDAGFTSFHDNTISVTDHVLVLEAQQVAKLGVPNTFNPGPNKGILIYNYAYYLTNTVWKKQETADFYVNELLYIDGVLTIEPGTTFRMEGDAFFAIGTGYETSVYAIGNAQNPITFTAADASPAAGSWRGIHFHDGSNQNTFFDYCVIEYGGKDDYSSLEVYATGIFKITNSQINHHGGSNPKALASKESSISGNTGNNFTWVFF